MSLAQPGLTDDHLAISLINVPEKSLILFEDIDCLFSDREDSSVGNEMNVNVKKNSHNRSSNNYSSIGGNNHKTNDYNYITFSGFLNALDGVSAGEERIVFMTTNYVDKLDSALIRPGRIDNMQYFGAATDYQIEKMFLRFYPEKDITNQTFYNKFQDIDKKYNTANVENINIEQENSENEQLLINEYLQTKSMLQKEIDTFVKTISGYGISMADLQEYFLLHKHSVDTALDDAKLFVETWLKSPRRKQQTNGKGKVVNSDNDLTNNLKSDLN